MMTELFTIGHSTHTLEKFIELLKMHSITALCDVRSAPYSRVNPQFNRETLKEELIKNKISYIFLGQELGARSDNPNCYIDGKVQFKRIMNQQSFSEGINRIMKGLEKYRIALMCAEKDPITCHRMILVCRHLRTKELAIKHLLADGLIEKNEDTEQRLLTTLKLSDNQLFENKESIIEMAYNIQENKIAYTEEHPNEQTRTLEE